MSARTVIEPVATPDSAAFWKATGEGRLLIRHCRSCDRPHWYPRPICPLCYSRDTEWREASGQGTIYSYSVMRRVPTPYAIAYVELREGPIMMTNIVDCDLDGLTIGQPVSLTFKATEGGSSLPQFRPNDAKVEHPR